MSSSVFFRYPDEPTRQAPGVPDNAPFLADLQEDEVTAVLGYTQARRYARGELAMRRGERERSLYIIAAGRFEVVGPAPGGLERKGLLQPGDIFGELAFFDGLPRSDDVRAVEDAEAVIMTPTGFDRLRLAQPQLALRVVLHLGRVVSVRFREYDRRLAALGRA